MTDQPDQVRPADRYGDATPPWHRSVARLLTTVLILAGLAWVVWAGLHQSNRAVRWDDVGFRITGNSQVLVTFDVVKDPAATVTCRLEALNQSFAVVGVAKVEVGPSADDVSRQTAPVTTQELAVTGVVKRCELR